MSDEAVPTPESTTESTTDSTTDSTTAGEAEHPPLLTLRDGLPPVTDTDAGLREAAAALGAEGVAADVRMLVGNGYVPGHAAYALNLVRGNDAVRGLFEARLAE